MTISDAVLALKLTTRQINFAQSLKLAQATASEESFRQMQDAMRLASEMMAAIQQGRSLVFLDNLLDPCSEEFGPYRYGAGLCADIRAYLPLPN